MNKLKVSPFSINPDMELDKIASADFTRYMSTGLVKNHVKEFDFYIKFHILSVKL